MIKFIYPEKDTFISNHPSLQTRNFGKDEVLEIENRKDYIVDSSLIVSDAESRALIKFDLTEVSKSIASGTISNPKFHLKMSACEFVELSQDYSIIVNPISQSWTSGTGRYADGIDTSGASWIYRLANTQPWSGSANSIVTNGGTWYSTISSQSLHNGTASVEITSVPIATDFYITSSLGEVYTFKSEYDLISQSLGYPSASILITSLTDFDKLIIKTTKTSSINVVNKYTPGDCGDNIFIGWGSDETTDASMSVLFTTESLYAGKKFVICDSFASWSFIASSNTETPDTNCGTRFFYVNDDNHHNVVSFSMEINSVPDFYVTASVSASYSGTITSSYLILTAEGLGELGNDACFLDFDDFTISTSTTKCGDIETEKVYNYDMFTDGTGSGMFSRFDQLIDALSSISESHNVTFNTDGYNIYFTSSISGSDAELFSIISGSTEIFFDGAYTTQSLVLKSDDISNLVYYFHTGSSLIYSINYLQQKITDVVDFVSVNQSASFLNFTGSVGLENITFQSGSSQFVLGGVVKNTSVSPTVSQSFLNETGDLNIDITDIVYSWINGSVPNEGLILRGERLNDTDSGKIRFYSMDTNTIYVPRISVGYDDQTFDTGELSALSSNDKNEVFIKNLSPAYKNTDIIKFRIHSRQKYPTKTYGNELTRYLDNQYLPVNSKYAVRDAESEEFIINFSDYTKISCDSSGSFFSLDMSTLPQERYFDILFKVDQNGESKIYINKHPFKIER